MIALFAVVLALLAVVHHLFQFAPLTGLLETLTICIAIRQRILLAKDWIVQFLTSIATKDTVACQVAIESAHSTNEPCRCALSALGHCQRQEPLTLP